MVSDWALSVSWKLLVGSVALLYLPAIALGRTGVWTIWASAGLVVFILYFVYQFARRRQWLGLAPGTAVVE